MTSHLIAIWDRAHRWKERTTEAFPAAEGGESSTILLMSQPSVEKSCNFRLQDRSTMIINDLQIYSNLLPHASSNSQHATLSASPIPSAHSLCATASTRQSPHDFKTDMRHHCKWDRDRPSDCSASATMRTYHWLAGHMAG